jgi:predicted nucleotidyltransferase
MRTISVPKEHIEDFCRRWKVSELSVDRSHDTERLDDLGLFVRFDPEAEWNLGDRIRMQRELQSLSGRSVQLHPRRHAARQGMSVLYDA